MNQLFGFILISLGFLVSCQRMDPIVVLVPKSTGLTEQENYQLFSTLKTHLSTKGAKILSESEFLKNKSNTSSCGENECLEDLSKKWGITRLIKLEPTKNQNKFQLTLTWLDHRKSVTSQDIHFEALSLEDLEQQMTKWVKESSF